MRRIGRSQGLRGGTSAVHRRVVVAMSGGVDSSLAAALVKEAGDEAIGVTLKLLSSAPTGYGCCGSPEDSADAKRVGERLGIPHYVVDLADVFERTVIAPFVRDYAELRTPNPCVECNRAVKFGAFLRLAEAWNASAVATGHYARVERGTEGWRLLRARDEAKDQTYFLHSLTQTELTKTLFPVGTLTKPEVRRRAAALGLPTADKAESMEVCFVPGGDYRALVRERAPAAFVPGPIRTGDGRVVGTHAGLASYTLGQRRGLGAGSAAPLYVTGVEAGTNTLLVGPDSDSLRRELEVGRVSWTRAAPAAGTRVLVRARHRGTLVPGTLRPSGDAAWRASLSEPLRAPAPGQSAVFYVDEEVIGGGTILHAGTAAEAT
ncbi:MAG: tRNA 2-thiouridine(34) synthase MnmA [Elusimicrobia bacterium]|nr:tRNA 2-thiouridine(34) synthase MnmA [Elusimicrobiota bacterium]